MDIKFELLLSAKLLIAILLGGIAGVEREREQLNTGIRTFACICVAACLFVSISVHLSDDKSAVARTLSAIVTGLGFIGAGITFRDERNMPKGLTTAAGLWATSAVGVAIALNMFILAIMATGIIFLLFSVNKMGWYRRFTAKFFSEKRSQKDEANYH